MGSIDWRHRADISSRFDDGDSLLAIRDRLPETVARVLDVGCGDGRRTVAIFEGRRASPASMTWLDPSPQALSGALRAAGRFPSAEHVFVGTSLQDTPLDAPPWDLVLALNSLYLPREELGEQVSRLARRIAPGGLGVLEISTTLSTIHRMQLQVERLRTGRVGLRVGRSTDLEERLVAASITFETVPVVERLRLGFPADATYGALDEVGRAIPRWLVGGDELDDDEGDAILRIVRDHATEADEDGVLIAESSTSLFFVSSDAEVAPPQAAHSGDVSRAGAPRRGADPLPTRSA